MLKFRKNCDFHFGLTNFIQFKKKIFPMDYQKINIDVSYLNDSFFDHCITLYITNIKYVTEVTCRDGDDNQHHGTKVHV